MKTKAYLGNSYTPGGMMSSLLMILCVLLILAVGRHLITKEGGWQGMGMGGGGDPIMYPPRQMPMFGGGGMFGLGFRLPQPTEEGGMMSGNGLAWPPDVLRNPYAAPLKDDRYLVGPPLFGVNMSTNPGAVDTSYRQIGTLSPNVSSGWGGCRLGSGGSGGKTPDCKAGKCDGGCNLGEEREKGGSGGKTPDDGDLLILMGRPLFTNRDTWQYYAISNQRNGVKLPVRVGGKNATNEYGVRELNGGEVITVDGYNKKYQVGMYEADTIRYLQ